MKLFVMSGAAVIAAATLSGVLVLAPTVAYADTAGAPAPSLVVQDALEGYPTVASLASAFTDAAPDAVITLSQDLTGVASDPVVSVRDGGAVTLDLNGHTLKLTRDDLRAAIEVPPSSKLTVTDTTIDHTGHLIVDANDGAGIGGAALGHPGEAPGFGTIVIAGAKVDATSRTAAAIGGAENGGASGDITITYNTVANFNFGSTVTATSQYAAGIGSAIFSRWQGAVTLTGHSTVTATGGFASAGIGGGPDSTIGTITINDAIVDATGDGGAAGIGGGAGAHGALPPIIIVNGNIDASGGPTGTGIGAGARGIDGAAPVSLTISGQSIVTPSASSGVAIDLSAEGSQLTVDKSELWIPSGNSVTIPAGMTVNNDGGTIVARGTIANHGTIRTVNGGRVDSPENVSDNNTTIKWDGNGGTAPVAQTHIFARTLDAAGDVTFPLPVRDGYVYEGWYPSTDGGTRLTTDTDLGGGGPKTLTYYAAWAPPGSAGAPPADGSGAGQTGTAGSGTGATLAATGSGVGTWAPVGGLVLAIGIALTAIAVGAARLRGGAAGQGNRPARPGSH
ncbi:InlB B-repeat-containing protein [Herbiconiux sp. A18JL235]|uniref:InlB B-repeat-containing protein n=1 Tax=Herbiconiux sp. A18JL235 TaxID=3152363 RepID=A0AB39BDU0_9MICO